MNDHKSNGTAGDSKDSVEQNDVDDPAREGARSKEIPPNVEVVELLKVKTRLRSINLDKNRENNSLNGLGNILKQNRKVSEVVDRVDETKADDTIVNDKKSVSMFKSPTTRNLHVKMLHQRHLPQKFSKRPESPYKVRRIDKGHIINRTELGLPLRSKTKFKVNSPSPRKTDKPELLRLFDSMAKNKIKNDRGVPREAVCSQILSKNLNNMVENVDNVDHSVEPANISSVGELRKNFMKLNESNLHLNFTRKITDETAKIEVEKANENPPKSPISIEKLDTSIITADLDAFSNSNSSKFKSNPAFIASSQKTTSVVRLPNSENEKDKLEPVAKKKTKKSVKELKRELELKSMKPITSFFKSRDQI